MKGQNDQTALLNIDRIHRAVFADERVRALVTDEISIGDYVLTGGEIPAMVLVEVAGLLEDRAKIEIEATAVL